MVNADANILDTLVLEEDDVIICFPLWERIIAKKVILLIVLFVAIDDDDFAFVDNLIISQN